MLVLTRGDNTPAVLYRSNVFLLFGSGGGGAAAAPGGLLVLALVALSNFIDSICIPSVSCKSKIHFLTGRSH